MRRYVYLSLATLLLGAVLSGCSLRDPRRHCTHPDHYDWVKEKRGRR